MKILLLFLVTNFCRATEFVFAPGPQEFKIELDGDVLSRRQTSITGPPGINGPIMFMAEPGTRLQTGELMITVAAERAEKRLKQEKRRLDQSLARLKKLRQEQERDQLKKKLEILEKKFEVSIKDKEIFYGSGEKDPRVIENLELQIELLDEQIKAASNKLQIYKNLAKSEAVSAEDLAQVQKDLNSRTAEKEQKIKELALKERGKSGTELNILKAEKTRLGQELEQLNVDLKELSSRFKLDEEKLKLVIEKREKEIEKRQQELEKARIKAPHPGTMIQAYDWMGAIGVGSNSWGGRRIAEIIDYSDTKARLMLPEKFIEHVKTGQKVILSPHTNPMLQIGGTVERIEAFARPINPRDRKSPKVHMIHVEFDEKVDLTPGGNLRATLIVLQLENAVAVPRFLGEKTAEDTLKLGEKEYPIVGQSTDHWFLESREEIQYEG